MNEAREPFLLLAHHRSGSNFLHDILQSHPCIECINEPLSMHTDFFRQCDLVAWSATEYRSDCLHVALAKQGELRTYLRQMRDYLLLSDSARIIGFKETALFGKLSWWKEFLPSTKVLWLVRDPRAVVSSLLRSGLLQFWRYRDMVPRAFRENVPHYCSQLQAPCRDESLRDAEVAAMSVVVRHIMAQQTLPLFTHRVVRLEEAISRPQEFLRGLNTFLGLRPHQEQTAFLKRRQSASRGGLFSSYRSPDDVETGWRRHLTPAQLDVIENVLSAAQCFEAVES
ncbi:MAG TPA: sulfotransferase [Burkholderiaceae bacterium]|nr:sulfotransferase [Burkholderiaceae bacterium]